MIYIRVRKGLTKLLLTLALLTIQPAKGDQPKNFITRLCLAGFRSEMTESNFIPPPGMGDFTCKCFLDEIKAGASISSAQSTCKEIASEKYNL